MKLAIGSPNGVPFLFVDDNIRKDEYGCWESRVDISLIRKFKENGRYCDEELELDESLKGLTYEDGLVDVNIVPDPNGNLWLGRNQDGSLCLCTTQPYRNSLHPWWSANHNVIIFSTHPIMSRLCPNQKDLFKDLKWEDEPLRVKLVRR